VFDNSQYYDQITGDIQWPKNQGFDDEPVSIILEKGTKIDRYGWDTGKFAAPAGTPYRQRSLPPGTDNLTRYSVFEIIEPLEVKMGKTAPWFDEEGAGVQYLLPDSIMNLLLSGMIRREK